MSVEWGERGVEFVKYKMMSKKQRFLEIIWFHFWVILNILAFFLNGEKK